METELAARCRVTPMLCLRCNAQNDDGSRFCASCGATLGRQTCHACGADLPARARFCPECGLRLAEAPPGAASLAVSFAADAPGAGRFGWAGERRSLTVMFCDLVGSTKLGELLDPEDLHHVTLRYQTYATNIVARYGGYVARYLGDGILVYFGYPKAHEDDACRATEAALGIVDSLAQLNGELESQDGIQLALRIGISSGPIVIAGTGGNGSTEMQVLGHAINIASHLQAFAEPNTVVISEATARLLRGRFDTDDLGVRQPKGVREPIRVFRVRRRRAADTERDASSRVSSAPFIGREEELRWLRDRWCSAVRGEGQVVLLSGEAGIGKSRTLQSLREQLAEDSPAWIELHGNALAQDSAFFPVVELQQRSLGFGAEDTAEGKLRRLERALSEAGLSVPETLPLIANLHSLPLPPRYREPQLSSEALRRNTLQALVDWMSRLAAQRALILVVEDLHWIDPSTLELVDRLVERVPSVPLLAIFTARMGFEQRWPPDRVTTFTLGRMTSAEVTELIDRMAEHEGRRLPTAMQREIVEKADGVPLFVEELTKMVFDSKPADAAAVEESSWELSVPMTLEESLTARLDQLGAARELAQFCATLGREFSAGLLKTLSPFSDEEIERGLSRLLESGLFQPCGPPFDATYAFKHALIHEKAYQTLLKAKRQSYHAAIATGMTEHVPEVVAAHPEWIAHHYTEARRPEIAIGYWALAGQTAVARGANVEAARHLTKGLRALRSLPESTERSQRELAFCGLLGVALIATNGYGAPEVERTFERARRLCQELGSTPQLFPVLYGLWLFYLVRADRQVSGELAVQLMDFAERAGDPRLIAHAHGPLGVTAFWQGRHEEARRHLQHRLVVPPPEERRADALLYGQDPVAFVHAYHALNLWVLGFPDQAVAASDKAIALAEETAHPLTLTGVVNLAADLRHHRGDRTPFAELARRSVDLATEQGFPMYIGAGMTLRGWALLREGDREGGINDIRDGLARIQTTGAKLNSPYVLSRLVQALHEAGSTQEALRVVEEALALARRNVDCFFEPDLERFKGEILLADDHDPVEAEACFLRALDLSRARSARSLELRAALRLGRLWRTQGKESQARALVEEVYSHFTEGFDTRDLIDARAFLEQDSLVICGSKVSVR